MTARIEGLVSAADAQDCAEECDEVNGKCIVLDRPNATPCDWFGTIDVINPNCYPLRALRFSIECPVAPGDPIVLRLRWQMDEFNVLVWTKEIFADTLDCNACVTHRLFGGGGIFNPALTCDNQFSHVDISFNQLDFCCEFCSTELQVDIAGSISAEFLCDDATCEGVIGNYTVVSTGTRRAPACSTCGVFEEIVFEYCEYTYEFDPPKICQNNPSREISQLNILIGIHDCRFHVMGEILQNDNVACFTHAEPLDISCADDAFDVTLSFCDSSGEQLCDWSDVTLRIRQIGVVDFPATKLGLLGLPTTRRF